MLNNINKMSKVFFIFTFTCVVYSCLCSFEINPRKFLIALSKEYTGKELRLPDDCFDDNFLSYIDSIHENLMKTNSFQIILTFLTMSYEYYQYCPTQEISTLLTHVYNSCIFYSIPKYKDLYSIALPIIEEFFKEEHTSESLGKILGNAAKILHNY